MLATEQVTLHRDGFRIAIRRMKLTSAGDPGAELMLSHGDTAVSICLNPSETAEVARLLMNTLSQNQATVQAVEAAIS